VAESPFQKDRIIADTGWGIKPDDQPSNAAEAKDAASTWRYDPTEPDVVRKILLAQRRGFNTANKVRIDTGRTTIYDINGDRFVVEGLSFGDENLIALLERLGAAFDPQDLRRLTANDVASREYALTRAWAWGAERPAG
jgi:hypothetical protein